MHAGEVQVWDLERMDAAVYSAQAHSKIVNRMDSCGGQVTAWPFRESEA